MSFVSTLNHLETDRLILRRQRVTDAAVFRQLWTERDPRVPPHRRLDDEGHPTVEDIEARIRDERDDRRPGLLTVERRGSADVIGYCGLVFSGKVPEGQPELAFELLRAAHNRGYATEAGQAVIAWASEGGVSAAVGHRVGMERRVPPCAGQARLSGDRA